MDTCARAVSMVRACVGAQCVVCVFSFSAQWNAVCRAGKADASAHPTPHAQHPLAAKETHTSDLHASTTSCHKSDVWHLHNMATSLVLQILDIPTGINRCEKDEAPDRTRHQGTGSPTSRPRRHQTGLQSNLRIQTWPINTKRYSIKCSSVSAGTQSQVPERKG